VLVAVLTVLAALTAAAPGLAAVSSEQAVAFLNQQRAANGIPGDLSADPSLTLGCQQHNRYMHANDNFDHGEDPGNPYYTPEGAGQGPYGGAEVLSPGDGYGPAGKNPWEWAPIHLYLMLDPDNTMAGYDAANGYTCMRMSGNRDGGEGLQQPQFFSYPGPGTQGIYPDEWAAEWPYTPQQLVGIPEYEVTGTNILFFSLGTRGLKAESFSLQGPGGPVAARMVDETTQNEVGSGGWFSGGGVLIPEQPLAEYTTYKVNVTWRNTSYDPLIDLELEGPLTESEFFTQEFSFTTGALSRESQERRPWLTPALILRRAGRAGEFMRLRLAAGRILRGQQARFVVYRHERGCGRAFASATRPCGWRQLGRPTVRHLLLRRVQILKVRDPDRWQKATVKVRTRQFKSGDDRVAAALAKSTIHR
jgi:hypothetical protein